MLLPEKHGGSETAKTRTHYNQIIMFICLVGVRDTKSAIPGALMCGGIGARMAPSQARQARWIGRGFCCLGKGMESARKRASNGRSRSVDKFSAIDVAHNKLNDYRSLTGTILGEQSSLYGLLTMPERHVDTLTELQRPLLKNAGIKKGAFAPFLFVAGLALRTR
jgi:hypothetical protein